MTPESRSGKKHCYVVRIACLLLVQYEVRDNAENAHIAIYCNSRAMHKKYALICVYCLPFISFFFSDHLCWNSCLFRFWRMLSQTRISFLEASWRENTYRFYYEHDVLEGSWCVTSHTTISESDTKMKWWWLISSVFCYFSVWWRSSLPAHNCASFAKSRSSSRCVMVGRQW